MPLEIAQIVQTGSLYHTALVGACVRTPQHVWIVTVRCWHCPAVYTHTQSHTHSVQSLVETL